MRHLAALVTMCVTLLISSLVDAQRQLPQDAKYVKRAEFNYPFVKLGKQLLRLSVGSRIYNEQNLIIMPTTAPATADVVYKPDLNGEISQIWILTPEESKAIAARK